MAFFSTSFRKRSKTSSARSSICSAALHLHPQCNPLRLPILCCAPGWIFSAANPGAAIPWSASPKREKQRILHLCLPYFPFWDIVSKPSKRKQKFLQTQLLRSDNLNHGDDSLPIHEPYPDPEAVSKALWTSDEKQTKRKTDSDSKGIKAPDFRQSDEIIGSLDDRFFLPTLCPVFDAFTCVRKIVAIHTVPATDDSPLSLQVYADIRRNPDMRVGLL